MPLGVAETLGVCVRELVVDMERVLVSEAVIDVDADGV